MSARDSRWPSSYKSLILERRKVVGELRTREGLTLRAIVATLAERGICNPKGGPWGLETVHRDIKTLEREWREQAIQDLAKHKARLLAELMAVSAQGWADDDLASVLSSIAQQRALLGTDEIKLNITGEVKQYADEFDSKLASIVARAEETGDPSKPH